MEDIVVNIESNIQLRECFIVCYDVPTTDIFIKLGVREYAYILHDNDYDENGNIKKPHYHLYLYLHKKKLLSAIAKEFNIKSNLVQRVKNKAGCIRYLLHLDDADKYQYNEFDICSNFDYFQYLEFGLSDSSFIYQCIEKIQKNEIRSFHDLTHFALGTNKIDLLSKRAYFFKMLLQKE